VFDHFTIYNINIIHQKKMVEYTIEYHAFLFFWDFKMQMKMCFMVLRIRWYDFGKVLEIFLKELVQALVFYQIKYWLFTH